MIQEKFQKKKKLKNVTIFSNNLNLIFGLENVEIWFFLYFQKSCRELNFLLKDTNTESIGILNRNLQPIHQTGAEDNTSSASSSISFQNLNGDQHQIHSSLSKQVYLPPQLQKKTNNLALKLSHLFPYKQRRPLPFLAPHSLQRASEKRKKKSCCATIILTLVVVQHFLAFSLAL